MKAAHQGVPVVGLPGVGERAADRAACRHSAAAARRRPPPVSNPEGAGAGRLRRRRHRQLADQPAVRPALSSRHTTAQRQAARQQPSRWRAATRVAPSMWPRIAPTTADEVCVTKPSSDDAAPARSGIRQQSAGLRLGQGHAHADQCKGRSPRSRRRRRAASSANSSHHHQSAERHRGGAESHRPAAAPAHHEARRDRGADHVARRADRERQAERRAATGRRCPAARRRRWRSRRTARTGSRSRCRDG